MVGIVAYGAYVPRLRLSRQAVYDANKWFAAGLRGLAKGERSMANWDEDSITMAVEASRDCLTQPQARGRPQPLLRLDDASVQGSPECRRDRHRAVDRAGPVWPPTSAAR